MATLYRKVVRKPVPKGAEVQMRKSGRVARWIDGRGKVRVERPSWYFDYQGPSG